MAEKAVAPRQNTRNKSRSDLTAERCREMLDYSRVSGLLRWRVKRRPRIRPGDIAGCLTPYGYVSIGLFGFDYLAHHLAWLIVTGGFPTMDIDHRDGIGINNKWDNLRLATGSQNLCNQKLSVRSTTGLKGVSLFKRTGRHRATIQVDGIQKHLGYFDTAQEAYARYCEVAAELHGEFMRLE